MQTIIVRPVITEKSMKDAGAGKFTFVVADSVRKDEIKKTIEETFKVNVVDVATTIVKGKTQRVGMRRTEQTLSSWKKAIVKLKQGQKIALFELGA